MIEVYCGVNQFAIEIISNIAIYLPKYSQDIFGIFLHMAISGIRATDLEWEMRKLQI